MPKTAMPSNFARNAVMVVAVAAIGGALFRVATGPDRIKERRSTAQSVCEASGGRWAKVGPDEVCVRVGSRKPS
ncbi:hypothetical protein BH11PSE8_BH11PSE8_45010 [soil metagenome]